ncbi:hypothetical protein EDB87DRAFT_832158 [Lactarius vividus]|nr:hypothetical protein EDB87DRAFT_832158 [Lactarius vividus]
MRRFRTVPVENLSYSQHSSTIDSRPSLPPTDPSKPSSSSFAGPLESPSSDTTARPALVFPSPITHPLPGSFPSSKTSESSVSFSALVTSSSTRFSSPALTDSSPSDSSSPASSSPARTSIIPGLPSSYISFSEISLTRSLVLDDSPDSNLDQDLDPSPSYHSTIAVPFTSTFPIETSSSEHPLDTLTEPTNQDSVPSTLPSLPPPNDLELLTLDTTEPPPPPLQSALPPPIPPTRIIPFAQATTAMSASGPAAMPAPRSNTERYAVSTVPGGAGGGVQCLLLLEVDISHERLFVPYPLCTGATVMSVLYQFMYVLFLQYAISLLFSCTLLVYSKVTVCRSVGMQLRVFGEMAKVWPLGELQSSE